MDSPWECKHYQLKVNAEELEQYIRQNETSASGLFALFVNRVIADQNICGARPVIGAMAIDARKAYHAEATMQCCVGTLPVYYDQELAGMPFEGTAPKNPGDCNGAGQAGKYPVCGNRNKTVQ